MNSEIKRTLHELRNAIHSYYGNSFNVPVEITLAVSKVEYLLKYEYPPPESPTTVNDTRTSGSGLLK